MATGTNGSLADVAMNGVTMGSLRQETEIPVVIFDRNGHLLFANQAMERCLIWKPDELLGLPVSTVLPNRFVPVPAPELLPRRPIPATARLKDGQAIDAEITVIAGNEGPVLHYGAMIRPLSEHHRFQYVPPSE